MAVSPVEQKRLIAELYRVRASKFEMDFKIEEKMAEIDRLKENMKNQDVHLEKLKEQLSGMGIDSSAL